MTKYEKWWDKNTKVISIRNYKKEWKENGIKPTINFHENGGRKKYGDTCIDIQLIIGYWVINYTNFNLQKRNKRKEN